MNLRLAGTVLALVALVGCKQDKQAPAQPPAQPTGSAAPAASADPWSKPAPKKDPLAHPLFWAVEKDGKTTYFLGTMHMGVDPTTRIPDLVWKKLDEAPAFVMETDLSQAGGKIDPLRHDGGTLHHDLGDAYWHKLETALGEKAASAADKMKPMIAATQLEARNLPETPAMDMVLAGHALNAKKKIVYLEPVELQLNVLDKWMDVRALKEELDDLDWGQAHVKLMLDAYISGDEHQIEALTDEERARSKKHGHTDAEYDSEMEDLLFRRNASWIPKLEELHASGGAFVAVGAMHLIGKKSVLDLLEQHGYKVTRVTP